MPTKEATDETLTMAPLTALLDQRTGIFLGDDHRSARVDRDKTIECFDGCLQEWLKFGRAGAVDKEIGGKGSNCRLSGRIGVREIDLDCPAAEFPSQRFDIGAAAGQGHDLRTPFDEHPYNFASNPFAGAGHDHRLSFELHGSIS